METTKEVGIKSASAEDWCSCIDGVSTRENYIDSIKEAGLKTVKVLQGTPYLEDKLEKTSVVISAVKKE